MLLSNYLLVLSLMASIAFYYGKPKEEYRCWRKELLKLLEKAGRVLGG
jgi:hypothetical protein